MSRSFTITKSNFLATTHAIFEHIKRGLEYGNVVLTLDREQRSLEQNSLLWALLTDVSKQVVWHMGRSPTPKAGNTSSVPHGSSKRPTPELEAAS